MTKNTIKTTRDIPALGPDEDGTAAIEFAILAPFIIGLYLGLAELSMGMGVERQISHSASVAGDLATQVTELEIENVADIMAATMRVAGVRDMENLTISLESFSMEDNGDINNLGSAVYNTAGEGDLPAFDVNTLGPELLSADSGVVVARVRYPYSPMGLSRRENAEGKRWLPDELNFGDTFILKPRRSTEIEIVEADKKTTCTGRFDNITCT